MSSSLESRSTFFGLVGLLPPDRRDEPVGAWDIGEQEGALAELVAALIDTRTCVDDISRARIAVLAEEWCCWDALHTSLASCFRRESDPHRLAIIEHTDEGRELTATVSYLTGIDESPWPGQTVIAWIACRQCNDVLVRVHESMAWGPALTATAYVVAPRCAALGSERNRSAFENGGSALAALADPHTGA